MVSIGELAQTPEYVADKSNHNGTLSVLDACSGARDDWPRSSSPGADSVFTYMEMTDESDGEHLFLTVTGARAQCVASEGAVTSGGFCLSPSQTPGAELRMPRVSKTNTSRDEECGTAAPCTLLSVVIKEGGGQGASG